VFPLVKQLSKGKYIVLLVGVRKGLKIDRFVKLIALVSKFAFRSPLEVMPSRLANFAVFSVLCGSTRAATLSEGSLEGKLGVGAVFPRQSHWPAAQPSTIY